MAEATALPEAFRFTIKEQKQRSKDGDLLAWGCSACGHKSFTPMYLCAECRSRDIKVVPLPGEGAVVSYTIQKISIEEFINDLPFAFVVVKLDDGTLVSGWVPDVHRESDLPIGTKVRFSPSYKPGYMFEKA